MTQEECIRACATYYGQYPYDVMPGVSCEGFGYMPIRLTRGGGPNVGGWCRDSWSDQGPTLEEVRYDHAHASAKACAVAGVTRDPYAPYAGLTRAETEALCEARQELCAWRERLGG